METADIRAALNCIGHWEVQNLTGNEQVKNIGSKGSGTRTYTHTLEHMHTYNTHTYQHINKVNTHRHARTLTFTHACTHTHTQIISLESMRELY